MHERDVRDLVTGIALFIVGAAIAVYTVIEYPIGTLTRMGPGLFPVSLGTILAALGVMIGVPAWFRSGEALELHPRPFFVIIGSIFAFVIVLDLFGVIPAVVVLTAGVVLADDQLGIKGAITLAVLMSIATFLLFGELLGVPFRAFRWPL